MADLIHTELGTGNTKYVYDYEIKILSTTNICISIELDIDESRHKLNNYVCIYVKISNAKLGIE